MASAMEVGEASQVLGMGHPRPQDSGAGRDINGLGLSEFTWKIRDKIFKFQPHREKRKIQKLRKSTKKNKENKVDRKIS